METLKYIIYNLGILISYGLFSVLLISIGKKVNQKYLKYFLYNFSAIFIALFLFETFYFVFDDNPTRNVAFTGSFADNPLASGPKDIVGYGPSEEGAFTLSSIRNNDKELVYDVTYSFKNGRRVVPNNKDSEEKIIFLGCSHVFGDGLNDYQTLPNFVGAYTDNNFDVKNYGFNGYGTHQALAITENLLGEIKNSHIIYVFIPDHIERAAGYKSWNVRGPKYEIENDTLVLKGPFKSPEGYFSKRMKTIWRNSYTCKKLFVPKATKRDYLRVKAMTYKMYDLAKENNNTFSVVVAGNVFDFKEVYLKDLKKKGIKTIVVSEKINISETDKFFIKGDGHPNEQYNRHLAKIITQELFTNE